MDRLDQGIRQGETELWEVTADMTSHPFNVQGSSFRVLIQNGRPAEFGETGMKGVGYAHFLPSGFAIAAKTQRAY